MRQETKATLLPAATGNSRNLYGGAGSLDGSGRSTRPSPTRIHTIFFKAFAPAAPAGGDMVIARLNVRAQPLDRGEVFEDPLDQILQAEGTGRVTGGGTMLGEEGEIEFCDLEITLPAATDAAIGALRRALEGLGAPKGSRLIWNDGANELAFGTCEGLAVYLNGTDLPDAVYENCDLDIVSEQFGKLVGSEGRVVSHWQGPKETALYLYGQSAGAMLSRIRPFLDSTRSVRRPGSSSWSEQQGSSRPLSQEPIVASFSGGGIDDHAGAPLKPHRPRLRGRGGVRPQPTIARRPFPGRGGNLCKASRARAPQCPPGATIPLLTTIDRYLVRQIVTTCLVMTGLGLAILLLERLLRLFSLVANPNQAFSYVGQMLVLLLPHFLSIALPAAFFFGVLLTFRRLKRDSEFVILAATGQSLGRLLAPVMGLALLMTLIAVIIVGYLSPHARYGYRALKHEVAEASLTAAVLGGTFIHTGGLTFFAESAQPTADGLQLAKVFVHQDEGDGGAMVVTGENGLLGQASDGESPVLILQQGLRAELPQDRRPQTLSFNNLSWPVVTDADADFRPRGRDQRELTLPELWTMPATPSSKPDTAEIGAELHARLVLIATVPLLPLLAAPLALAGSQRNQRGSIVIGLLVLVVYYELLSFGEALAKRELLAPELGLWLPFLALASGTGWLFLRTVTGSRLALRRG